MAKEPRQTEIELLPDAWARFERAVDVVAKSPPQHRTTASKPRKVTRKKPAKNAMPSASERPFQSFLSVRYSEVHWPSGWSLRTSPDQIARLQISRESVHRLFGPCSNIFTSH